MSQKTAKYDSSSSPDFQQHEDLGTVLRVQQTSRFVDLAFADEAIRRLNEDRSRSVETPLLRMALRGAPGVDLYLKDEAAHPTGSLKHRLARALFTFGVVNGSIRARNPVVEASSGSTAVSEAYFAKMLDLPFHAVMSETTSPAKIAEVEALGGTCHLVAAPTIYQEADSLANRLGGVNLDQFTFAERVSDWRRDNVAAALLEQMEGERHALPDWIVVGAGTGGTAATIGRHLRARRFPTRLCVADVERSAFFDGYALSDRTAVCAMPSRIEGVGRPRMEPSFVPALVDRMIKVPDPVSVAGMRVANRALNRRVGPSTGLNFAAAVLIAQEMALAGRRGSIALLICDGGERYSTSCYCEHWLADQDMTREVEFAEQALRKVALG